ncbi:MAG TPA: VWA domain-containing protein [Candidatus Dormibacteraeota bacterium]|nr:VWA domain-containing protein [Candidatus Dormibacteraeota bacterium]
MRTSGPFRLSVALAFLLMVSFLRSMPVVGHSAAARPSSNFEVVGEKRPEEQQGRIRREVNLVNVLANVLDRENRPAPDLPKESFEVYEEGVLQKIEVFESETHQSLDLALMIDSSLSTQKEMLLAREAAAHFIRQVVRPGDRLSVFEFSESVTQLTPFTSDVPVLQAAVRRVQEGAGTSLYDAVLLASEALARRDSNRRRVIVLVTDAGETTSRADFDNTRRAALKAETLLYTIVIRPVKNESGRNTAGEHAIQTITETTGGAMFFPDQAADLDRIFDRIDRELRTQYRVGYYPHPRGPASSFRHITIKVKGDYTARSRQGYFTAP